MLKGQGVFKRDKDYVIMNGELLIVDEHTGRVLAGRRYSEGLHQALEAKERVEIRDENQTWPQLLSKTTSVCTRSYLE